MNKSLLALGRPARYNGENMPPVPGVQTRLRRDWPPQDDIEKEERYPTMKLGIVGLPNVGKSTLFNAITNAGASAANYPFCTIEPNVGVVAVPRRTA